MEVNDSRRSMEAGSISGIDTRATRSRASPALPAPDQHRRASREQADVAVDRDGDVDNRAIARVTANVRVAVVHNALDGRCAPAHTSHSSTAGPSAFGLPEPESNIGHPWLTRYS